MNVRMHLKKYIQLGIGTTMATTADYLTTDYNMVKCHENVNFKEIDTEPSIGKSDGF